MLFLQKEEKLVPLCQLHPDALRKPVSTQFDEYISVQSRKESLCLGDCREDGDAVPDIVPVSQAR